MPSTRYISQLSTRHVGVGVLALLLVFITALTFVLPVAKAYATDDGGTTLGIIIIDSKKGQASPGTTTLGIRVTNSKDKFETEYKLTFNLNGAPGTVSSVTAIYNRLLPKADIPPSRTGYTFLGYYDSLEGGKQIYDKDGTSTLVWTTAKNTTLYAHWQAATTLVSFDQNTGSGGQTAQVTATYDSDMPAITTIRPTKDNHAFLGYFDKASGGTMYYDENMKGATTWDKADDIATLYAQWQIDSYTMTWNANGGNWRGSTDDKTTTVNHDALVTPPKEPSRPGYKFDGWYKEGLTVSWNFQTDKPTQNTTLYAKWSEQILCTVPVSTLLQVDARGEVTDITDKALQFSSQTTAPIVVDSATSTLLAGANSLFPDADARKDVAILITPQGGVQKSIPLETTATVSLGFQIETGGTLPVSFGLHLPATARLNYLANDGTAEIASISYTVSLANP